MSKAPRDMTARLVAQCLGGPLALLYAFTWRNTEEGDQFWSDIRDGGHTPKSREILRDWGKQCIQRGDI